MFSQLPDQFYTEPVLFLKRQRQSGIMFSRR